MDRTEEAQRHAQLREQLTAITDRTRQRYADAGAQIPAEQMYQVRVYDEDGQLVYSRTERAFSPVGAMAQLTVKAAGPDPRDVAAADPEDECAICVPGQCPGPDPRHICGARTWPYTEHNVCVREAHSAGRHKDDKGREFG